MQTPAPFIVGSPRSGTTLLRMMLDSHPLVAIPPETGFLPSTLRRIHGCDERRRQAFLDTLVNYPPAAPGWLDHGIPPGKMLTQLKNCAPFHLTDALRCFYLTYAARFGKSRWGDKTPHYGRRLRVIERMLPEARFVHIIRDGRDVALSLRGLWFSPGNDMATLARRWCRDVTETRREGAHCRRYLELRYEDLVRDPDSTLRGLCAFLDLDYDAAMLRYPERAPLRLAEHRARSTKNGMVLAAHEKRLWQQRLTMSPPDASRASRWTAEMLAGERSAYEAVAEKLLADLQYL